MTLLPANDNAGRVLAFTVVSQSITIGQAVDAVSVRQGNEADSYWRKVIAHMRAQMISAGLGEDLIEAELRDFAACVFARIGSNRCA